MKHETLNVMRLEIDAVSINENFARQTVSAFTAQLDPALDELADIRCAVSEAVTNCVVHAYRGTHGVIYITAKYFDDRSIRISVKDKGCGIDDVARAMQPLYTTDTTGERGGMGFAIMENFCDNLKVNSNVGAGTTVTLYKKLRSKQS